MDTGKLGADRGINPPGLTVMVREMLATLDPAQRGLVRRVDAPHIEAIVGAWPARFVDARARALGFAPMGDAAAIVREFAVDAAQSSQSGGGIAR